MSQFGDSDDLLLGSLIVAGVDHGDLRIGALGSEKSFMLYAENSRSMTAAKLSISSVSLPCRVTHVITGLYVGGAETMLYKLLAELDSQLVVSSVVSLVSGGEYADRIRSLAIPVHNLSMKRGVPHPQAIWKLSQVLRSSTPAIVQSWMYHADLLGALAAHRMRDTKLAWNIRHSNLERGLNSPLTRLTARLCAILSHWAPAAIVCNSVRAKQIHIDLGYAADKFVVIPNGFDIERFRPDESARMTLRTELGLAPSTSLIGMIGRYDEQKDHATFIEGAALLHRTHPSVHFLLCGANVTWDNKQLTHWVTQAGLVDVVHLLGQRTDVPHIMSALDLLCSSSVGEAFPNVVGEAMACAVPCIVTDVGDSALLVGDTGFVVPPRQPYVLAATMAHALDCDPNTRAQFGCNARQRIIDNFSIKHIASRYLELYLTLANS